MTGSKEGRFLPLPSWLAVIRRPNSHAPQSSQTRAMGARYPFRNHLRAMELMEGLRAYRASRDWMGVRTDFFRLVSTTGRGLRENKGIELCVSSQV